MKMFSKHVYSILLGMPFLAMQAGSDFSYLVAVSSTEKEILTDWKWLEEILVPTLGMLYSVYVIAYVTITICTCALYIYKK